jgi:hypothetical protein
MSVCHIYQERQTHLVMMLECKHKINLEASSMRRYESHQYFICLFTDYSYIVFYSSSELLSFS